MASRNRGSIPWKVWIPAELALQIETMYLDPHTGKPQYGTRSHLVVALLEEFHKAVSAQEGPGIVKRLIDKVKEPTS